LKGLKVHSRESAHPWPNYLHLEDRLGTIAEREDTCEQANIVAAAEEDGAGRYRW
jgi:hypothetical protein